MQYTVFGASWCQPCQVTKKMLTEKGIEFEFVDIDVDHDRAVANSVRSVPTMVDSNGNRAAGLAKILELIKNNEHPTGN